MKILITSIVDLKKSQHNRPHQFVKYLSKNHEVTVLSVNDWWKGNQADLQSYSSVFDDIFDRIDYHYITDRNISPFLQELLFTKEIKKLAKYDFDIHLNYNSLISGYRASKNFNTVFDLADDIPQMIMHSPQIPKNLRYPGKILGEYYLRKNIKRSEFISLTTETLTEAYDIPAAKTEIIPNGVDTQIFRKVENAKKELDLSGFTVGYVGALREWVDLKTVFNALKMLKNPVKLLIVGKEGRFNEYQQLAQKLGVSDKVIFTGMIPYNEIPKYISAMDVCLIPFKQNSIANNALPIKLFEYMACEKPVISTHIAPVKSKVGDDIYYASNSKEYADKINLLYQNDDLIAMKGKNGRKIAENHNWEELTFKLEKLLIKAAER